MGALSASALALWCALVLTCAHASAYTVDCNHEYTDCDTELSKLSSDDEDIVKPVERFESPSEPATPSTSTAKIKMTPVTTETIENDSITKPNTEIPEELTIKPKPRLLNLNVDELQNFANALHNDSNARGHKKIIPDLSDVTLDGDDDDESRQSPVEPKNKDIPDKFYTNLQAPFHALMATDRGASEETDTCKENEVTYKVGDHMDRGCEEICECASGGVFECSPRCKHPYIRRGRRLNDPLCFESPVDECCSIIACATGDKKTMGQMEMCTYANETHTIGSTWNIGCQQTCTCERNSVVTCKPRCSPLPVSDKCINVQDPNDPCCEVQVCDVSHDVHEEPENVTTTTTTIKPRTTTEMLKGFQDYDERENLPSLNMPASIGSVTVLQNNSVQVNLMHMNNSMSPVHLQLSSNGGKTFTDVELTHTNLILNLEGGRDYILKSKETGAKFNFTITATDSGTNEVPFDSYHNESMIGCYQDGQFYAVGDEFHIGCEQLCECTGMNTRECAALVCPSHVGLELVSKGCVRWAPNPPATPPNCCPRTARCLSDGTCHYKGVAVPNWSEVPITLTGCEQRCFCENGELDCQDVCSPLPPVPPQNLRCPPNHRPAAVNISDEDCCKQWGCVPNATKESNQAFQSYDITNWPLGHIMNYVTPQMHTMTTIPPIIPTRTITNDAVNFYKHLKPVKSYPKYIKAIYPPNMTPKYDFVKSTSTPTSHFEGDNVTVFDLDNDDLLPNIHSEQALRKNNNKWPHTDHKPPYPVTEKYNNLDNDDILPNIHSEQALRKNNNKWPYAEHEPPYYITENYNNLMPNKNINCVDNQALIKTDVHKQKVLLPEIQPTEYHTESPQRYPTSKINSPDLFLPSHARIKPIPEDTYYQYHTRPLNLNLLPRPWKFQAQDYFEPSRPNTTANVEYHVPQVIRPKPQNKQSSQDKPPVIKHVTILNVKDLKTSKMNEMYGEMWDEETKNHVMTKLPNPYDNVVLRPVPNSNFQMQPRFNQRIPQMPNKSHDIEHWLNQMEMESVVNKNLRSADNVDHLEGQPASDAPPFLPTVPPEIHFPQEDIDYDQNNIHRPTNPIEPALAGLPPGLTIPPSSFGDNNRKLSVISLQSDSPTSVKMLFGLPPVLVGLRGSVDLRYTDKSDQDISHWYSQVFAPADEILTTPRLEFRLTGLKPSTRYKIRGKLYLHNLPVEPESEIYNVQTQDLPVAPTEEKRREIDCRLTVTDVNDTTAHVTWRHFDEQELIYIDGIQVRYRPVGTPIYSMTELLHHSRSAAELHDLRPDTKYETSLVLVPPPRSTTELIDPAKVEFRTMPHVDPYNWTVNIEVRSVGAGAAEVWWSGIPAPAERWVRVFRAAHACKRPGGTDKHDLHDIHSHHGHEIDKQGHDHDRYERDAFRLAARDLPPAITISGLLPDTKCRVWLELFLTNGKVKTSNVLEINTKSLDNPEPIDNEIASSSVSGRGGDYYGALVGVGAVAALGAFTSLLLLLVVLRRHRPRSVPITSVPSAPRESSLPPYDNPAYKLELQQETMDL